MDKPDPKAMGHRWQKGGRSPNPKGRPRVGVSLATAVRQAWPADKLVALATKLAKSDDDGVRMRALEFLAERGYGKVPTTIDATLTPGYALDGERILARLSTNALRELLEASDSLQLDGSEARALDAGAIDVPAIEAAPTANEPQHQTLKPRPTDDNEQPGHHGDTTSEDDHA